MQIKIFNIPIPGGEQMTEEMNLFLRSKRVLQTEHQLVSNGSGTWWCFLIKYLDEAAPYSEKQKVDYRLTLDPETFKRFSAMREIRKRVAQEEGVQAYNVFLDEELAGMAKIEALTPAAMRGVKGIGEKKLEKYGHHFISKTSDEKSQPPA